MRWFLTVSYDFSSCCCLRRRACCDTRSRTTSWKRRRLSSFSRLVSSRSSSVSKARTFHTHTRIHLQYRTCVAVNPLAVSIRYPPVGALCKSSVLRGHFIWVYLFWFTICVNLIWDMYKNMSPRWFKKPTSKAFWKTVLKCTEGKSCFKSAKGGHTKCWFNLVNSSLLINIFSQHPYFAAFLHKCLKLLSAL